ncbi:MAG: peptidase MA domain-containing protein [Chloroflexi bacterium]|nr:peptidase MA domain-containing protein [Chloroflexota bacterium]MBL7061217.1 peptidase MA domain-containing protein [Dehalococcoidia bacterium]
MIKRLILLILAAILFTAPNFTHAQEQISLLDNTVEVYFPSALVFKVKAASQSDITKIRLHYQVDKMNYAQVTSEAWPDFIPSPEVETEWVCDMRKVSLPAGVKVEYWWTIETKAGDKLVTYSDIIQFDDLRYSWKRLTVGQLSLFWYKGSQSFAEELMAACQQALERLVEDTGVYLEKPISLYIYASTRDLQGAMIFPQEWTGGVAFTEHGIIAIGVPPDELAWGKRALAHELGHMVTHQITFSPYGAFLPIWLDEGLAMHAEGEPDTYLQSWLKKAISQQKLISVRSLSSPFSAKPEEAYISYAESQSLVEFLIQNYGKDKMLRLLSLLKEGNSCDEALTEVYGFDQDGLDKLWREYITGQNHSQSVFEYASLQKVNAEAILWEDVLAKLVKANILLGCID